MTLNIGEKLDTIAKLLAGAPPGPEEKFLFQKYVYCKEDYTSWVVSLLGDLGIKYTQVDSLVNGLYEYRCECTNDAFNQMILKVELSTNPVLATYKKIDSFSDLVGINIFDMDSYAAGCDSRMSKSNTVTPELIKYWLNVQNDQIVQRQLDLAGSASIGTYSIDFTGGNAVSGSVPVNGSIRDNILYRKKITGSAFGYSLTNCTIEGWIIDYLKNTNDQSVYYTVVTGGADADKAYNDNLQNYVDYQTPNPNWATVWEVSFPEFNPKNCFIHFALKSDAGSWTTYFKFEIYDGSWHTLVTETETLTVWKKYYKQNIDLSGYSNVTGLRVTAANSSATRGDVRIYDISLF